MEFVLLTDKQDLEIGEIILSLDEVAELLAVRDILYKVIDKSIMSYQLELWNGRYRGKEESIYSKIEWFLELKTVIEKLNTTIAEYRKK